MSDKFLDKKKYNKAKKIADDTHKKNSAYKSLFLLKTYKDLGGKINQKSEKKSGTTVWLKEKWKNLSGVVAGKTKLKDAPACGNRDKNQGKNKTICRPTVKVNKETVKLAQNYSKEQLKKAQKIKNKGDRINWKKL
tara:strand:+ start:334 stop:741 length:408 start_codon:yes stop_codon:yes gene_type:complete